MTKFQFRALLVIAGIVVGALFSLWLGSDNLGGVYSQTVQKFYRGLKAGSADQFVVDADGDLSTSGTIAGTGTFTIGANGSAFAELKGTTCNLLNADTSIAATSSGYVYCTGVTGIASGDMVVGQLSTTTPTTNVSSNMLLTSARASTTAGAIDFMLINLTGASVVPSAINVGSSTNIWYADF